MDDILWSQMLSIADVTLRSRKGMKKGRVVSVGLTYFRSVNIFTEYSKENHTYDHEKRWYRI